MISTASFLRWARVSVVAPAAAALVLGMGLTGCGGMLDVDDPTAVLNDDLNNASGAQYLRGNVLTDLVGDHMTRYSADLSGLLADELRLSTFVDYLTAYRGLDRREPETYNTLYDDISYPYYQQTWGLKSAAAIERIRAYSPTGVRETYLTEMYVFRAFAGLRLAEHYCPGFSLNDVKAFKVVFGPPLSTDGALERVLAAFDSALAEAPADSTHLVNLAHVGRARTLLGLGRFAEAATEAALVPTDFEFNSDRIGVPKRTGTIGSSFYYTVADNEGGNGLDFVSAHDPRVPTQLVDTAGGAAGRYVPTRPKQFWLWTGIEARLIEAEVALQAAQPQWLAILNTLRTTCTDVGTCSDPAPAGTGGIAGLPPLSDPGSDAARQNLLFRERAFWNFGTGSRLGDLRRLVRVYGRSADDVFPTGTYWAGGSYGSGSVIPFPKSEAKTNPGVTGCTSW